MSKCRAFAQGGFASGLFGPRFSVSLLGARFENRLYCFADACFLCFARVCFSVSFLVLFLSVASAVSLSKEEQFQ